MFDNFIDILNEELVAALGCTEPIAIAYAAAKAKEVLGEMPDSIIVNCSGNIIKNVKAVTVPSTINMKGIQTSAILGALAGDASKNLEALTSVKPCHVAKTRELLEQKICEVTLAKAVENLFIEITAKKGDKTASVTISDGHTNIIKIKKDGNTIFEKDNKASINQKIQDRSNLSVSNIYEFANTVDIKNIKPVLDTQIKCNMEIANEGIKNKYGTGVGKTLLKYDCDTIKTKAKAYTAAGSDARMGGCVLPVVINSGSGNQGMTVSIPVILYAQHIGASDEKLYRALALSNLLGIHQKSGIGKLSAYCGAVSAACAAGAAIAYLDDQPICVIQDTITNSLLNVSGIVCDGAKPSCAAKIASSVDAAFMGYHMALQGDTFIQGEGLVGKDIEKTIENIGLMAKIGMKQTDVEILTIMISQ